MEFWESLLASGIRLMVPVGFAAIGEAVAERAGVLNLGLEAYMAAGGFVGLTVAAGYGSTTVGVLAAAAVGAVAAAVMALLAVRIGAGQIISGFAVLFVTLGIVNFLAAQRASERVVIESMQLPERWSVPGLSSIPVVGEAVFEQNFFYWLLLAFALVSWWFLSRTEAGLIVTATGHDPSVVAGKGIDPIRVRFAAVLFCGAAAGIGGAALSMGAIGSFTPGQVNGRGFVAIAVVILGRWRVPWVIAAALIFGMSESLQLRLQDHVDIPVQLLGALPWLVVLVMLVVGARGAAAPRAVGLDYRPLEPPTLEQRLRQFLHGASGGGSRA